MHRGFADDTSLAVVRVMDSLYARMTPAEKLRRVTELTRTADAFALAGLRRRHPEESDEMLQRRLAELRLEAAGVRR